jgi:CDP-6-deoxy-D-xylo-4-hexulose-3-dehydrase
MTDWIFPTAFSSWQHGDGSEESNAIDRVLSSGRYTMGPETEAFEAEIAAYHGRRHAIAVNSGSSANLIAVAAAKHWHVDNGYCDTGHAYEGRASVPAIAWATTYAPLLQHRYNLTIADVDDTWNAPNVPWRDITMAVSILGNPTYLVDRLAVPGEIIVEDNCESLGARTGSGQLTGTFGRLSTGSGFYSHQLSAVELGWILTDNDDLANLCRLLRNHGNDGWGSDDLASQYDFVVFGYNVRPQEINCAVARAQLRHLDAMIDQRTANLMLFRSLTANMPIRHQLLTTDRPSPFGLPFTVETPGDRARLAIALRANGIDCRMPTGGSFLKHPYSKPWRDQSTPNADRIHDTGMFLGNAPRPIPDLIRLAAQVIKETL